MENRLDSAETVASWTFRRVKRGDGPVKNKVVLIAGYLQFVC
jgi:hypothetical protein